MSDRKHLSILADVYERLEAHKHEDESWSDLVERAADALEEDGNEDDVNGLETLTEEHIDDIAARTARKTADEVQDRLTGR
ncbi:MAG: antitoxin VapB family protein [Halapricum sp.]